MSMQHGNLFSSRHNSLLTRSRDVSRIFINDSLKSIDIADLKFINFLKSNLCQEYVLLSRYIEFINNNDFSFLEEDFYNSEFTTGVKSKNDRLKTLIFETSNTVLEDDDLINIVKYKNRTKKGLQLFIKYDNNCNAGRIYLIDLYHLVIPTEQRLPNGTVLKSDLKKKEIKNNIDLSTLKNLVN